MSEREKAVPLQALVSGQAPGDWPEANWDVAMGCTKLSPGCRHCYAAGPLGERGQGFALRLRPARLSAPRALARTGRFFVAPLSDLFHEDVPDEFLGRVFDEIEASPRHVFHVITRRAERLARWSAGRYGKAGRPWPFNAWVGVSVESQAQVGRALELLKVPAETRFLSAAPLLGPVRLPASVLAGLSWIITSEEHGPGARPAKKAWLSGVFRQGTRAGVTVSHGAWRTCPYPLRLKVRHLLRLRACLTAKREAGA